ncbi:hypothetical protein VaNZ11_006840, partial [Volvox africanus]
AAESRVTDADLEAAYESILEAEDGDLDPDLRSLIASGRRRGALRRGSVTGAPGSSAGLTGKRLSGWRWMSRATMPDAAAAAAVAVATDDAEIVEAESTAVAPAPAQTGGEEEAEAVTVEFPPDLLLKIGRLQQLVRLQQANLSAPQRHRLENTAPSAPAPTEGQQLQQLQLPQLQLQPPQLQPQPPAGPGEFLDGELEAQLSAARSLVEQAQARLAEWRRRLPPTTLEQLDELDRQQQQQLCVTTANGQREEGIAHSSIGNGNGTGVIDHGNGNGNGTGVIDHGNGNGFRLAGVATGHSVGVDKEHQPAAVASVAAAAATGAAAVDPNPVNWMEVARRRIESHVVAGGVAEAEAEAEAEVDLKGTAVCDVNGRKHNDKGAAVAATVVTEAGWFPTSHPLEGGGGSGFNDSDHSDSGNGKIGGVRLRDDLSGFVTVQSNGKELGGGRSAADGRLYMVWQGGGSAGAEADPELHVEESAEAIGGDGEIELVVDLEALRSKFFAAAPPPSMLQKGRAAAAAADGCLRDRGDGVAGTRVRSRPEKQRSRRVRR